MSPRRRDLVSGAKRVPQGLEKRGLWKPRLGLSQEKLHVIYVRKGRSDQLAEAAQRPGRSMMGRVWARGRGVTPGPVSQAQEAERLRAEHAPPGPARPLAFHFGKLRPGAV